MHPNIGIKLHELSSWQQTQALTNVKINVGFERLLFEDASVRRILLREERLVVAVPIEHDIMQQKHRSITPANLSDENLLLYPKAPRPSFINYT